MARKHNTLATGEPRRRRRPLFFLGTLLCLGVAMLFYVITSPRRRRAAA